MTPYRIETVKGKRYKVTVIEHTQRVPWNGRYMTTKYARWELIPEAQQLNLFNG